MDHQSCVVTREGTEITVEAPYFYHYFQSDFEDLSECLELIGFLLPLVDLPGRVCLFKLTGNSSEVETIAYQRAPTGPPSASTRQPVLLRAR